MQILYVVGIMVLSVLTLESVITSQSMRTNANSVHKAQAESLKITWQLSRAARLAYETSVANAGTCPAGTTAYTPPGTTNINLCWGADMQNDCFQGVYGPTGKPVCLRTNQQQVGVYSLLTSTAYANGGGAPHHVHYANSYNGGLLNPNPTPTQGPQATGANGEVGAFVRVPQPNPPNSAASNHVDCNALHTECFSITYCLDGTNNCGNAGMVIQTFATRWF